MEAARKGDDRHLGPNNNNSSTNLKITNTMRTLKKIIDTLGVTLGELRSGSRKRQLSDARCLIAAALPVSQRQMAELLNCTQPAVSFMRQRHKQLLVCDLDYRNKWEKILDIQS